MGKHKAKVKQFEKKLFARKKEPSQDSFKNIIKDSLKYMNIVAPDVSTITMMGNTRLHLEKYDSILEYTPILIKIQASGRRVIIEGQQMNIAYFTADDLLITGFIHKITYI